MRWGEVGGEGNKDLRGDGEGTDEEGERLEDFEGACDGEAD